MNESRVALGAAVNSGGARRFEGPQGQFIGGILGTIGRGIKGAIGGIAREFVPRGPQTPQLPPMPSGPGLPQLPPTVGINPPFGGPPGVGVTFRPRSPVGLLPATTGTAAVPVNAPPKGYRLNKSSYWLKSGEFVPAGTRYVKIRRRNPLNPRAASRAMSRLSSAKRAVKDLNRVTIRARS